jgi:NAD dependent epimerase/dehydratase family enzyme
MGTELLLAGAPVAPRRLLESGFRFEFPTLAEALRFELGRGVANEAISR